LFVSLVLGFVVKQIEFKVPIHFFKKIEKVLMDVFVWGNQKVDFFNKVNTEALPIDKTFKIIANRA
jgi:hypothetical protein